MSSRGILYKSGVFAKRVKSSDKRIYLHARQVAGLRKGDIVYVSTTCLEQLVPLLKFLVAPIVLVTGDADETVDTLPAFVAIANHPMIAAWFAQNAALRHEKVR